MFDLRPIAWAVSTRSEPVDDSWGNETTRIVLDEAVPDEALLGIDSYSHLEIIGLATMAE